jgi:hypothetical protein
MVGRVENRIPEPIVQEKMLEVVGNSGIIECKNSYSFNRKRKEKNVLSPPFSVV